MASKVLETLMKTSGVMGVAAFDTEGNCVDHDLKPPYEPIILADIVSQLETAFDVFSSLGDSGTATGFAAHCSDGHIVLRKIEGHTLVALVSSDANMNMLNVALNVAALNIRKAASASVSQSSRDVGQSLEISGNISGGGMRSMSLSSSGVGNQPVPADAVGRELVRKVLNIYQQFIGPAAKVVLKQQLAALGVTSRTLRKGQWGDFTAMLAQKIPTPSQQQAFTQQVMALVG